VEKSMGCLETSRQGGGGGGGGGVAENPRIPVERA